MKTIHTAFVFAIICSAAMTAQETKMMKPVVLTTQVSWPIEAKKHVKKINPVYAYRIQKVAKPSLDNSSESKNSVAANSTVYEIKAFPNPFTNQIDVIITDGTMHRSVYKASLYDMSGKKVFSETLSANQSTLQLAQLSAGMYMLHIEKNGVLVKSEKFVKQ